MCLHHFTFVLESLLLAAILLFFCVSVHVFKALFHEARFPNKRGLILCLKPNSDRASGEMLKHVAQVVMWSQGCWSVCSIHDRLRQSSSSCNMTDNLSFLYSHLKCVNYTKNKCRQTLLQMLNDQMEMWQILLQIYMRWCNQMEIMQVEKQDLICLIGLRNVWAICMTNWFFQVF